MVLLLAVVRIRQRFATNIATRIKNCHRSSYPIRLLCGVQHNTLSPVIRLRNYNINPLIFQPLISHGLFQLRGFANDTSSRHRRYQDPDMRVCQSIEELTQMAYEHISTMSPRGMSAYWTLVSKLLRKSRFEKVQNIEQMNHQLEDILGHTLQDINSFGSRDLAQTSISFAKIINKIQKRKRHHYRSTEQILQDVLIGKESKIKQFIFTEIAKASTPILHEFEPRELSNLIYAYGLAQEVVLDEDGSTFFNLLAEVARPNLHKFNGRDLSNMLWAYANVKLPNSQLFEQAGDTILELDNLNDFNSQNLSNTVWSYATLNEQHTKLFKRLGDAIVGLGNLDKFSAQALANILWAYATAKETHPKLFKKVAYHIVELERLHNFKPQELKDILWAFATAKEPHPKLFKRLADHIVCLDNLHNFKPQELSNTLWAYATAEESYPNLFKKVANHIITLDNLDRYDSQALKDVLWTFATAGEQHPILFKKIADHIIQLPNLNGFKSQALSNTVWAFATAGESHPQLFKKISDHIITLDGLDKYKPQALANILWAFATAKELHPQLFKKVADHIVQLPNLDRFDAQALSNIPWAFATTGESHPQLFNKLAEEAIKRQHEFIPQVITNFLWAYSTNGQVDKQLFSSLVPAVKDNLDKYNAQDLANVAWAYSVANVDVSSVFTDQFITACLRKEEDFESEELRQLHQWQLWQEEIKSDLSLPSPLQKRCCEAFISQEFSPSRLQDDVVSILSLIGLQPQEEVLMKSGYRIDAVVEVDGKQIAVEVDGPSHFIGREPNGGTLLKNRQVSNLDGIQVISIPYWEWNEHKYDNEKKKQYLRALLGFETN